MQVRASVGRALTVHNLITALGVTLVTAVGAIGASVSFQTLKDLAQRLAMPGPAVVYPIGVDVGILAFILADLMYTLRARNAWHLRLIVWGLTGFTVWANGHGAAHVAGLSTADHNVQVGLHVVMPLLWVAGVEAIRQLCFADARKRTGAADTVPLARWAMSPVRTVLLYRRMRLWGITSYPLALAYEDARLHGIDIVRARNGFAWRLPVVGGTPRALRIRLTGGTLPGPVREVVTGLVAAGRDSGWEPVVEAWITTALAATGKPAVEAPQEGPPQFPWLPLPGPTMPLPDRPHTTTVTAAKAPAVADPVAAAAAATLGALPAPARPAITAGSAPAARPRPRRTPTAPAARTTGNPGKAEERIDPGTLSAEELATELARLARAYEDAHGGEQLSINEVVRRFVVGRSRAKELLALHYGDGPHLHAVNS